MLMAQRLAPDGTPLGAVPPIAWMPTGVVQQATQTACAAVEQYGGGLIPQGVQQQASAICAGLLPRPGTAQPVPPLAPGTQMPPSAQLRAPAGSVYRYNTSRRVYVIYAPVPQRLGVASLSGACLYGNCAGLGQPPPDPAPPAGMTKIGEQATQPAGLPSVGTERDRPWYKNWKIWAGIGGGLAVLSGGVYIATR